MRKCFLCNRVRSITMTRSSMFVHETFGIVRVYACKRWWMCSDGTSSTYADTTTIPDSSPGIPL